MDSSATGHSAHAILFGQQPAPNWNMTGDDDREEKLPIVPDSDLSLLPVGESAPGGTEFARLVAGTDLKDCTHVGVAEHSLLIAVLVALDSKTSDGVPFSKLTVDAQQTTTAAMITNWSSVKFPQTDGTADESPEEFQDFTLRHLHGLSDKLKINIFAFTTVSHTT